MSNAPIRRQGKLPADIRLVLPRRARLPRTLGAGALFAACYGNVGSSIYYALGVTAAFALGLTPVALLLAGGIFVTTALNYAEGTVAIPHAGGSSSFARRAFNDPIGFLVGWVQLLNYTATASISAYFAIGYLAVFGKYLPVFSLTADPHWHALAAVALVAILIVINVIGIQESSALNFGFAILDLGTQVVLVVLGILLLLNFSTVIKNVHWGVAPTWSHFLASISIAMVSYTGIETISNMAEEARNPSKSVPRATFGVIIAVLFVSAFLPTIGMSVFPVHTAPNGHYTTALATTWKNDPVAGIVAFFRPETLAFWAEIWVGILAFSILVIATNAGLIGISRLSYSLASSDLFPKTFARLHPHFRTPFVSIIVFGVVAALLILPAEVDLMAAVYSLAATFAFATAHLAVMRLRFVEPESILQRPYKMPFNLPFGRSSIPLLSLIGALAIGSVFTQLLFENVKNSTFVYLGWLVLGALGFIAYRRYRRAPLWEPLASYQAQRARVAASAAQVRPPLAERVRLNRPRVEAGETPVPAQAGQDQARAAFLDEYRKAVATYAAGRRARIHQLVIWVPLGLVGSGIAVGVDLSPLDPFGRGIGWSPGILVMIWVSIFLLLHGHGDEEPPPEAGREPLAKSDEDLALEATEASAEAEAEGESPPATQEEPPRT